MLSVGVRELSMQNVASLQSALEEITPAVFRVLRRMGVMPSEVDDAMQGVLIQIASRWARLAPLQKNELRAYACTVASGVAIDALRRGGRARVRQAVLEGTQAMPDSAGRDPENALRQKRDLELLDTVLDALPAERRAVFVLFELEELTLVEIAGELAIPIGTVASRLRKAREEFERAAARVRMAEEHGRGGR